MKRIATVTGTALLAMLVCTPGFAAGNKPITVQLLGPELVMPATVLAGKNDSRVISASGPGVVRLSAQLQEALRLKSAELPGTITVYCDKRQPSLTDVALDWTDNDRVAKRVILRQFATVTVHEDGVGLTTVTAEDGEAVLLVNRSIALLVQPVSLSFTASR